MEEDEGDFDHNEIIVDKKKNLVALTEEVKKTHDMSNVHQIAAPIKKVTKKLFVDGDDPIESPVENDDDEDDREDEERKCDDDNDSM